MSKREKIKAKIKALLSKTIDNGASKEEMEAALFKANKLMTDFFISEHDLSDPYIAEKCILKEVPIIKSGYDLTDFYNSLTQLFDCKYFYNKNIISFFGFEEDTELCSYFYKFIVKTCLKEKAKYMKSEDYAELKKMYHGRTLSASFIKGFMLGVCVKMDKMYRERRTELSAEKYGLMVIEKKTKVQSQFGNLGLKVKTVPFNQIVAEQSAYNQGSKIGKSIDLIQGVNQGKNQSTLSLNA